jgi:hypothetical protein
MIIPTPNNPNHNPNTNANYKNLKDLYDMFYIYVKTQSTSVSFLKKQKELRKKQIESILDNKLLVSYKSQYKSF